MSHLVLLSAENGKTKCTLLCVMSFYYRKASRRDTVNNFKRIEQSVPEDLLRYADALSSNYRVILFCIVLRGK